MIIELTEADAKNVAEWLQESFNLLEVGGTHRIAAVRLMEAINKKIT